MFCSLDNEGKTYTCNQASHTATPATANSKETNQQLENGGNERHDVSDEHPLGDALVGVHSLSHPAGKLTLHARILQAPDFEGVEVVCGLGLGAEGGLECVVGGDVARAVAPDTDSVEVLEVHLGRGIFHEAVQVGAGDVDVG